MEGGGPYRTDFCPLCGSIMWNGQCENRECNYHWHPMEDEDDEGSLEDEIDQLAGWHRS
jgi:hypothetical protein